MSFKGVVKVPANWTIDKFNPLWDPLFSFCFFSNGRFLGISTCWNGKMVSYYQLPSYWVDQVTVHTGTIPRIISVRCFLNHISHRVDELDVPFSFKKWCPFCALEMSVFFVKNPFWREHKKVEIDFPSSPTHPPSCGRMTIAWSFGRSHTLWVWKGRYFFGSWLVLQRGRSQSGTEKKPLLL